MNPYLASSFGIDGKAALLTDAGEHHVGKMSRIAGHARMKVVCCDLWLEDALRAGTALQVGRLGSFAC